MFSGGQIDHIGLAGVVGSENLRVPGMLLAEQPKRHEHAVPLLVLPLNIAFDDRAFADGFDEVSRHIASSPKLAHGRQRNIGWESGKALKRLTIHPFWLDRRPS